MGAGQEGFSLGQNARSADRIAQPPRICECRPQEAALRIRIGTRGKGARQDNSLAIRFNEGNINPIEGRARHQTYGAKK
jgi:hypothetical protein